MPARRDKPAASLGGTETTGATYRDRDREAVRRLARRASRLPQVRPAARNYAVARLATDVGLRSTRPDARPRRRPVGAGPVRQAQRPTRQGIASAGAQATHCQPLCRERPVLTAVRVAVTAQLPADRRRAATQSGRDRPYPKTLTLQVGDADPLVLGQVPRRDLPLTRVDHCRIVQPPTARTAHARRLWCRTPPTVNHRNSRTTRVLRR